MIDRYEVKTPKKLKSYFVYCKEATKLFSPSEPVVIHEYLETLSSSNRC